MKHLNVKKTILSLLAMSLFVSCAKPGSDVKPIDPPKGNPESIFDELDYKPNKEDAIDFSDKAYYYNDHLNDVEPNHILTVIPNPDLSNSEKTALLAGINMHGIENQILVKDNKGLVVDLKVDIKDNDDVDVLPQNEIYTPGRVYTAELQTENFVFKGKDPEIKTLIFDVKRPDKFKYKVVDDLKYFDVRNVVQFAPDEEVNLDPKSEEAKEWFYGHTYEMIYATDAFNSLKENENFAICPFKSGQPKLDEKNSFYGKFVSSTKVGNGYKVVYKNVDLNEIYEHGNEEKSVDVHINEQKITEFRDVKQTFDENLAREYFANDKQFNRFLKAVIIATKNESNVTTYDVLTHLKFSPSFSWEAPKFCFQLKIGGTVPLNEKKTVALYFEFIYQYTTELSAEGSVEVEKFLGVPYWIVAKSEVIQTITHKVGLKIALMKNFQPEEEDTSNMKDMVKKAYDKLENDPAYFMDRTGEDYSTSGNERFFPIADLNFPFAGIFSLYVSFDIHLTLDLRVMLEYNYVNEHTKRMISFTTDDGVKNTSNTETDSVDCHSIDFIGTVGIQLGVLVRGGVCVTGLSKIFGMGFSVEAGIYFDFKGLVGLTFGENQDTRFLGGIDFDAGIYGQVSAFLDILCFHPKYDFLNKRKSFFGYYKPFSVIDFLGDDEITLTEKYTTLSSTNIMSLKTFSIADMAVSIQTFRMADEVEYVTLGDKHKLRPVTLTTDCPYISFEEDTNCIVLADYHPPKFDAEFTITANETLTYFADDKPLTKIVKVHFASPDAHTVSLKGTGTSILLEKGKVLMLPQAESNPTLGPTYHCKFEYTPQFDAMGDGKFMYDATYYDFFGYTDGVNTYQPGDSITVGDSDIVLEPIFKVIVYYTATFYNGKGEYIGKSRVREKTAANAPSMEEIMRGMEGYTFYGWDRSFDYMTEDISVYGIYYKGGQA